MLSLIYSYVRLNAKTIVGYIFQKSSLFERCWSISKGIDNINRETRAASVSPFDFSTFCTNILINS